MGGLHIATRVLVLYDLVRKVPAEQG